MALAGVTDYCGRVVAVTVSPQMTEVTISPDAASRKLLDATLNGKNSANVGQRFKKSDFSQEEVMNAASTSLTSSSVEFCFPTSKDQQTAFGSDYFFLKRSE